MNFISQSCKISYLSTTQSKIISFYAVRYSISGHPLDFFQISTYQWNE